MENSNNDQAPNLDEQFALYQAQQMLDNMDEDMLAQIYGYNPPKDYHFNVGKPVHYCPGCGCLINCCTGSQLGCIY